MRLKPGLTSFHGIVLNQIEARRFRYLERQLRKAIDEREPIWAQYELQRIKDFAGDVQDYRTIFEIIRNEADDRWRRNFGTTWSDDIAKLV